MRWINLPLLKQSWLFTLRNLLVLGPVFVLFGFVNDSILSIGGVDHARQAVIMEQLQQTGGGLEGLAGINNAIGTSQNPVNGLTSIGLLLFAASVQMVIILGLIEARFRGESISLSQQLSFFRRGFTGSLKGFWRGFLRFLGFATLLAIGILASMLMKDQGMPAAEAMLGLINLVIFLWMMVFLLPYIFATIDCILTGNNFDPAFAHSETVLNGKRGEIVLTFTLCGAPSFLGSLPLVMLQEPIASPLSIGLTYLLILPSTTLLFLYHKAFAVPQA